MFLLWSFLAILAILPPCGSAVGTSKELGRGLVSTPRLDEPVERFVIVAFRAFSLGFREGPNLLFFAPYDDDFLSLVGQPADLLIATSARVAALSAGHEHLLLSFGGKNPGPALRTGMPNTLASYRPTR